VDVLRAIPVISSTLALRVNAGSIESPIQDSIDGSIEAPTGDRGAKDGKR
jgi:hypothetical protein